MDLLKGDVHVDVLSYFLIDFQLFYFLVRIIPDFINLITVLDNDVQYLLLLFFYINSVFLLD